MGRIRIQDLDDFDQAGEERITRRKRQINSDDETLQTKGRKLNKRNKK